MAQVIAKHENKSPSLHMERVIKMVKHDTADNKMS